MAGRDFPLPLLAFTRLRRNLSTPECVSPRGDASWGVACVAPWAVDARDPVVRCLILNWEILVTSTRVAGFALLASLLTSGLANAQVTVSGFATADNAFQASISTSPTDAGTPWFSGSSWPTTFSGSTVITEPGTYFLQVRAQDFGQPQMFIGLFTLTGSDATFANGTQELRTNTIDWVVSTEGFGVNTTAPSLIGPNGFYWGTFASMPGADFIWAPQYANGVAFFTASFTVVPAPGAALAMIAGLGIVSGRRRR